MLEVHPPHENVHSWRQFFIHIVAITIGLLIAIGLEQTVVYFHHRHQLQEARGELAAELESNRRVVGINLEAARKLADGHSLASVGRLVLAEALVGALWAWAGYLLLRFFEVQSFRHATLERS